MLLIYLIIVWHIHALPKHQYNMYNTDQDQNGFCLFHYQIAPPDGYFRFNVQLKDIPDRVKNP